MSKAEEAALATANSLLEGDVEAEETPSEPTDPVAEEPQETEAFTLEPELPEDLVEELDEPDFEEEAEAEVEAEDYEENEYEDEQTSELKKKLRAAEKKAEHFEKLRAQSDRKKWADEAKKFFPLSVHALDSLDAKSRRGYLRQAKAAHEAVLPYVKQAIDASEKELEAARAALMAEAKDEAAKAWGQPTVAPGDVPAEAAEAKAKLEKLIANRAPLEQVILARAELGELNEL